MRYLVTGIAGFIGSHIAEALVERGHEVRGLDNFATGSRQNLEPFIEEIEFVEGDIRDLDTCRQVCQGVDYVIHQAALGSVPRSLRDPLTCHEVNATGTLHMLISARDAGVEAFVAASSSSVYGNTDTLPKHEGMKRRPLSPYAASKVAAENHLEIFASAYGLATVGLRYFNIFGPRQSPDGPYAAVIPRFIRQMRAGDTPTIFGDGEQSRDFTYVANAVRANLLAVERASQVAGTVINVGCGERISLNVLYRRIARQVGFDKGARQGDRRPGDVKHSLADITRACDLVGYSASIGLDEGLARTVEWFNGEWPDTSLAPPRRREHVTT
ncbi:SDR family oxidoreductase [Persicimonas caeni]|uniref:SDR family oxidoreductase n=1 Tax=Persicimonas caeni TaxID=2292766 RepID=A0A4Y6PUW0_PERCE|nr:SDR family oxidoreductase [Persicimonas caeni]QDG52112.1 SDR family oxidoreductase [Persicimonas caeni]QED33333.1 SDR family oxidoreductase [Persicimonas caeni]